METEIQIKKHLPSLKDLVEENALTERENALMVLLNQDPPKDWIKQHPTTKTAYLPIERVEYLLSRIFTKWWVEVKAVNCIANSVVVSVRLYVTDPITNSEIWNDGIGASPIQTDKGAGATDWTKVKSAGVMMAAPSAESFAIKDAAEKFGKLFGKDLNRKDIINYTNLLNTRWTQE